MSTAVRDMVMAALEASDDPRVSLYSQYDELPRRLATLEADGRDSHPTIKLTAQQLGSFCATQLDPDCDPETALGKIDSEMMYFLCGCLSGDEAALRLFKKRYFPMIEQSLVARLDKANISEVQQRLLATMFVNEAGKKPRLSYYKLYNGRFEVWLRVVAIREGAKLLERQARRREVAKPETQLQRLVESEDDPELRYIKQKYRTAFKDAFQEAMSQLEPAQRTLLRLYYLEGLGLREIGKLEQVHLATIGRRLASVRTRLFDLTREVLAAQLNLPKNEFTDLLGQIQSRLEISISRVLRDDS